MREIEAILSSYDEAVQNGHNCVLATVVHVEGSSYRGAGTRMLVDEYGYMTGAISGGCLEGDALRKALLALDQGRAKLITYDTSDEDDAVIGAQLGCNGIIQVLFEPIDPQQENNPMELLRRAAQSEYPVALATFFSFKRSGRQRGTALLVDEESNARGETGDTALDEKTIAFAGPALENRQSQFLKYEADSFTQHAFIETIIPPTRLVLIGAGNDAQVLSRMAGLLGWEVTVADGRPSHANAERFGSCQVVVSNPGEVLDHIEIRENTAFVLMSHNYNYDLDVLKLLLSEKQVSYIGILGPKKKYNRMLGDLEAEGLALSQEQRDRIYAPVGLQLGAETPAEIGLSVLAEIQALLTCSTVRHLRELQGPIHSKEGREFREVKL